MTTVVVAIPCFNEAATVAKVVSDFRVALPEATVYVFDNNSSDDTANIARAAGAEVVFERRQGKGHVMQAILQRIDSDVLIVVDGDDTYPARDARRLIEPILSGEADMVVGTRLPTLSDASMYRLNRFGNHLILRALNFAFRSQFTDVLSGYRAFSRRLLEQVPLLAPGFETEVELTIQTMEHGLSIVEVPVSYQSRPAGSSSKLRPFKDGYRILVTMAVLLRDHRPLAVFGSISVLCLLVSMAAGVMRLLAYSGVHTVPVSLLD